MLGEQISEETLEFFSDPMDRAHPQTVDERRLMERATNRRAMGLLAEKRSS